MKNRSPNHDAKLKRRKQKRKIMLLRKKTK